MMRSRTAYITLFLFLILVTLGLRWASEASCKAASKPETLIKKTDQFRNSLYRSSKRMKYRHNWLNCIKQYENVYKKYPKSEQAVWAMYRSAEMYKKLNRYSGLEADLDKALEIYKKVAIDYKDHRLADDAQYKRGEIIYNFKKDPTQAYVEFLKVEVKFPKGDARLKASRMMDKLELVLGKKRLAKEAVKKGKGKKKKLISVKDIRHWSTPTYTRVVIDLEDSVKYKKHLLKKDPDLKKSRRLFVDLHGAWISKGIESSITIKDGLLRRARAAQYNKKTVRVVLDIDNMEGYKIFHLYDPFRIVLDVQGKERKLKPVKKVVAKRPPKKKKVKKDTNKEISLARQLGLGVKRIIIDAGHGGKDPGAIGRNGLREKHVMLKLANLVAEKVKEELKCQAILTRGKDVFLPLEKRTAIANMKKGDLFISLHTNAHKDRKCMGIETYFLNIALDEDSMNVAARENATSTKNISDLQMILNDLMLNTKINESSRLARFVHKSLIKELRKKYNKVQNRGVRQAPFYVLIGAEMPAILLEVGYITNSIENRRLCSATYLKRAASGIVRALIYT